MTGRLSPTEQAAVDSIDSARIGRELATILAIPSVTGDEEAVQAALVGLMAESGLSVERVATDPLVLAQDPDWPGSEMERTTLPVVIGRAGVPGGRRVIVLGHVDVVPVGDVSLWRTPPWTPTLVDGALFARGAVTKGYRRRPEGRRDRRVLAAVAPPIGDRDHRRSRAVLVGRDSR